MPQISDLLEDLEFIQWVQSPSPILDIYWENWIHANPDRLPDIKLAREIVKGFQFPSKVPSDQLQEEILHNIIRESDRSKLSDPSFTTSATKKPTIRWQFTRVAAILLLGITLSLLYNYFSKEQITQTPDYTNWLTKSTNPGEKMNFRLPDQTIVWMNSESTLSFPEKFDSTVRLVELKGEAFFEVSENKDKPFQVISEGLITTALGTSFNINSSEKNLQSIALVTGKVSIQNIQDSLTYYLNPGQGLSYNKMDKQATISDFDSDLELGWRMGKLIFKNASLNQVLTQLKSWYGVEITVSGAPKRAWRLNGKFENQSLNNVLRSISNIENFTYHIEGKKVDINFN